MAKQKKRKGRRGSDEPELFGGEGVVTYQEAVDLNTQALLKVKETMGIGNFSFAAMVKGLDSIKSVFASTNRLQTQTLATNRTYNDVIRQSSVDLQKLPGDINAAVEGQFEFLEAGLLNAGEGSLKLSTTMKAVGLSTSQLIKTNLDAATFGRATPESLDNLNAAILKTTTSTQVSFNKLIGAMDKLSTSMKVLGFLGSTAQVLESQTKLIGKFGAGSADLIAMLVNKMFDLQGSMAEQSMLGIFGKMQTLRSPGGATAANFEDVMRTAAKNFSNLTDPFLRAGVPLEAMADALQGFGGMEGIGALSQSLLAYTEGLTDKQREDIAAAEQYRETMQTFTNEVWKPLKLTIAQSFGPLMKGLTAMVPFFSVLVKFVVPVLLAMKAGQLILKAQHAMSKVQIASQNRLARATAALAVKMGLTGRNQAARGVTPGMALMGGWWGIGLAAASIAATVIASKNISSSMDSSLDSIDDKTPDPEEFTSLFASRTSSLLKSTVLSTILGGNALLEALNTSNEETAARIGSLVDILLAERTAIRTRVGGRSR